MNRYVAFLRAINVGGHVVKMEQLRKLFEGLGLSSVSTFIASGNVIFESRQKNTAALEKMLENKIGMMLQKALGYEVAVFIRSADEVADIAEHNAYEESDLQDGALYIGLLQRPLSASEQKTVASMQTGVDTLRVHKREIYWLASRRFRDAEFSPARLEKALKSPATFRNITTIRKIAAIVTK